MMNNNEFAKVLKERLEQANMLQANEEFLIECVDGIEVAKVKMPGKDGEEISMALKLEKTQQSVEERGWETVLEATGEGLKMLRKRAQAFHEKIEGIEDYEKVKNDLIIRPIHFSKEFEKKIEKDPCMYSKKGDIALVLYLIMSDIEGVLNTIKVPMKCVEGYKKQTGMNDLEIFAAAMENTAKNQIPTLFKDIFATSDDSKGTKILTSRAKLKDEAIALVTTSRKTNGAIAMFVPGVKEKIAEMYGDSFYVAFTSVHEAMIHKNGSIEPISIKRNVTETNRIFGADDTLSNNVFFFDKETKEFRTVDC